MSSERSDLNVTIDWMKEVNIRKKDIIEGTQAFLRIPSVLDEQTATKTKPFGTGIAAALNHLLKKGKSYNFFTKNVDGFAGLIEYGKGEESVGILVHLDVVPAGEGWTSPPFSADIRDGRIYARGAIDNKGPAMAAFYAVTMIKELGLPVNRKIQLILGTDEESEWRCVEYYFKHEEMPTVGFVPDADFPIIYAEKGIADIRFNWSYEEKIELTDELFLICFHSGERFNMVPDVATASLTGKRSVLDKIKAQFLTRLADRNECGSATWEEERLVLTYEGKAAHGSTPEKGENAGHLLADFLSAYTWQNEANNYITFIKTYLFADLYGEALKIAKSDHMSGPLTVNAGVFRFKSNEEATIGLNVRYPVSESGEALFQQLQQIALENGACITIKDHMQPSYVNADHPLIQTLQHVYERQTGEKAELLTTGGGTYARSLKTGVAFGPLFPGREDVAHQKDEYIAVDDLLKATAIYAEAIYELAK